MDCSLLTRPTSVAARETALSADLVAYRENGRPVGLLVAPPRAVRVASQDTKCATGDGLGKWLATQLHAAKMIF